MPVDLLELGLRHATEKKGVFEPAVVGTGCRESSRFTDGSGFLGVSAGVTRLLWHQFHVERLLDSVGAVVGVFTDGTDGGAESLAGLDASPLVLELQWCLGMQDGQYHWSHAAQTCRYPGLCPQRMHLAPLFFLTGNRSRLLVGDWCVVHGGEHHTASPGLLNCRRAKTVSAW